MQIREQGKQIQLIRSTYNPEKKRCEAKVIGHLNRWSDEKPSDDLLAILSDEERAELDKFLSDRADEKASANRMLYARVVGSTFSSLCDSVAVMTPEQAAQAYEGMDRLKKALRKAGHKRLVKTGNTEVRTGNAEVRTGDAGVIDSNSGSLFGSEV